MFDFFEPLFFALFALGIIGSGAAVVLLRRITAQALLMALTFACIAGMFLLLGAETIALFQVLIYVGAITILILFAIMLTETKDAPSRLVFQTQAVPAAIASTVIAVVVALAIAATDWGELPERVHLATDAMSRVLFSDFVLPFEIVSVLLLAAVIGGVFLAKREPGGPS